MARYLTESEKRQHVITAGEQRCPYCRTENTDSCLIDYEVMEPIADGKVQQKARCTRCGRQWIDEYQLRRIVELTIPEAEQDDELVADAADPVDARIVEALRAAGHKKQWVIYSAAGQDENDNDIDNLDEIAAPGKVVLFREADWDERGKDYCSEVLENPTWLQVAVCANKMIKTVRDGHHVFLEGLEKVAYVQYRDGKIHKRKKGDPPTGVDVYRFCMGS